VAQTAQDGGKAEFVRTDVSKALPPNPALLCGGPYLGGLLPVWRDDRAPLDLALVEEAVRLAGALEGEVRAPAPTTPVAGDHRVEGFRFTRVSVALRAGRLSRDMT
jgi:hypothetical protein